VVFTTVSSNLEISSDREETSRPQISVKSFDGLKQTLIPSQRPAELCCSLAQSRRKTPFAVGPFPGYLLLDIEMPARLKVLGPVVTLPTTEARFSRADLRHFSLARLRARSQIITGVAGQVFLTMSRPVKCPERDQKLESRCQGIFGGQFGFLDIAF